VEQLELLKLTVKSLEQLAIPYAVVGSYASSVWGEARFTQDIDIVVALNSENVGEICQAFPPPEFYVSEPAARDAVERGGQFNVIHPSSGNKIDFMVAGQSAWSQSQLQRARMLEIAPGVSIRFAAPEDVILGKLLYFREGGSDKHLRDIAGIQKISGELVDQEYIEQFAEQLGVLQHWQVVFSEGSSMPPTSRKR
jgi:hypothetical protein